MSIETQIRANAEKWPDKVALIGGEVQVTYAELWQRALAVAACLREKYNLQEGECVILAAAGNIEFVYAYLGVHIAGGICVPIDPDTNETRFDYIYEQTQPRLVLGRLSKVGVVGNGVVGSVDFASLLCNGVESNGVVDSGVVFNEPEVEKTADVLFTTGTTGAPKGVTLSYGNLTAAARHINLFIGNTEDDVELLALPVSHSFGLGRLRCVLSKGGTLVMLGTFANIKRFFREMENHHVTGFGMVPASWGFIKKISGRYIEKFSQQLKYVEIGSSFMSVEDKQLLMELLPNTRICMHYGLTEASRSAYMEFHSEKDNLTTAGQAANGVEIALFSPEGKRVGVAEEGEVCVKGKHVCSGYWKQPKERFEQDCYGEYFRTGDCGVMDEKGYIYLRSRIKEMINVGGKKVAPMEVEDILNQVPGVKESACIGMRDPEGVMGEVVKAFIVTEGEVEDKDIMDYLKPRLEVYKLPVAIERLEAIPKTTSGKIQRLKLKEV